ncbi:glycosyltransferase [Thermococcus sp. 101 C5]|uniref:glycosyltransferase n=1 Tax=Thermococcus sp. 101 C5 TaxID=2654197 RepID=UPI00128B3260|nr:glycosyltransferase [Thermococcus sp. 101 C5]MPW38609.1 glycosyltransferase [Thermococcus sp. 101 C5]
MKILQVIPAFPPAVGYGGGPLVAYEISRRLVLKGHDVTVVTTDANDEKSRVKEKFSRINGIKVHYFKNISNRLAYSYKIFISPGLIPWARRELKNFDVIHLHDTRTFQNLVIHYFAKKYGIPYVLQPHGTLSTSDHRKVLKKFFDFFGKSIVKDAEYILALNEGEVNQIQKIGVPRNKIRILPNGIDLSNYTILPPKGSFKKKLNISQDKKIILYLGRIHKTKGIDLLIGACAYLINNMNCKNVVLVIAGPDDGYMSEAKAMVNSLGISDLIIFAGFLSSEDKLKALVDADVFVTPMFYGFPVTFLEACAVGTPIVTTNAGETLEWINGKVGYVTQPNYHDLAEAIYKIIYDEDVRNRFSKNCIEIVKSNFSWEKVVEKLEKIYEEVITYV